MFARLYFRLEVIGRDRVPVSGGFVFAPVHRSNLDFAIPAMTTRRMVRWMAKDSIFVGGPIDRFLSAMGAFPVHRSGPDRAALRTCLELLREGEPVVMFPEGRRKSGDLVTDLFDGPAFVACKERVPVVPVGIGGSDRAMPIGSKFIFPRRIVVVVGEPLYPEVPATGRVPRADVEAFTAEIRDRIQSLYDDARHRASSRGRA